MGTDVSLALLRAYPKDLERHNALVDEKVKGV